MGDVLGDAQTSGDEVAGEAVAPEHEKNDPSPASIQSAEPRQSSRQSPRPPDHQYRPGQHGQHASGNYGTIPTALNMADMTSALPPYPAIGRPFPQQNVQQPFIPVHQSQGTLYPVHQMPYLGPNVPGGTVYNMPYSVPYHNPYMQQHQQVQGGYSPYSTTHLHQQPSIPMHPQSPTYNPSYYTQHQYNPGYDNMQGGTLRDRKEEQSTHTRTEHQRTQMGQRSNIKDSEKRRLPANYNVSPTIVDGSSGMKQSRASSIVSEKGLVRSPFATVPSTPPRGPPRKPKQSGHALWVGNLPPSTNVVDLKDHFSKEATNDIESVFLISKSNCAFVNYKNEIACAAAVTRFHDSRFHGVRLVCRLRRGSSTTGPGTSNPQSARSGDDRQAPEQDEGKVRGAEEESYVDKAQIPSRVPERFFIVKSLTVEDLEISRQTGIWATQTHNEATLNQAYESADNVYLIFSANKSGEYFGYARMASPITDDEALALEAPPRLENASTEAEDIDVIPTEATETAPKGRIIDDLVRGTIFWEADSSEDEKREESEDDDDDDDDDDTEEHKNEGGDDDEQRTDNDASKGEKGTTEAGGEDVGTIGQTLGKPFRIEWMSTERVPFYRTRGLRNLWNSNREVKIARDGTELEPNVGRKLTQLFHLNPNMISPSGSHGVSFQPPY